MVDSSTPVVKTKLSAEVPMTLKLPIEAPTPIIELPAQIDTIEITPPVSENTGSTDIKTETAETLALSAHEITTLPAEISDPPSPSESETLFYEPPGETTTSPEDIELTPLVLGETEVHDITELNEVIAGSLTELPEDERILAEDTLASLQEKLAEIFDIFIEQSGETNSTTLPECTLEDIEELEVLCIELLQQLHIEHDEASVKHLLRLLLPANIVIPGLESEKEFGFTEEGTHEFKLDGAGPGLFTTIATMPGRQAFDRLIGKYILHLHNEILVLNAQ